MKRRINPICFYILGAALLTAITTGLSLWFYFDSRALLRETAGAEELNRQAGTFLLTLLLSEGALLAALIAAGIIFVRAVKREEKASARLEELAYYDSLTMLPNRPALMRILEEVVTADPPRKTAVFIIDIGNFKRLNDGEGHSAGDVLLGQIASFLREVAAAADLKFRPEAGQADFVARLGGDEFVMVCRFATALEALNFAQEIFARFNAVIEKNAHVRKHGVSLSVGISHFPKDAQTASELLRHADLAMNRAQGGGKFKACVYNAEIDGGKNPKAGRASAAE